MLTALWLALSLQNQDVDQRIERLEQQMQAMAAELADLKKLHGIRTAPAPVDAPVKPPDARPKQGTDVDVKFDNGLSFKSEDGNVDAKINAHVIEHYRAILDRPHGAGTTPDTFFLREAILDFKWKLWKQFEGRTELNFQTGPAVNAGTILDAWLGWRSLPEFNIRFGQFKEPVSAEETMSPKWIDLIERSDLNRLVPSRDIGLMFDGKLLDDYLGYEVGYFNGQGRAVFDGNDEKDVAGRLRIFPLRDVEDEALRKLRIGFSGTRGHQDTAAFADVTSVMTGTRFLDADADIVVNGTRNRLAFELTWPIGPASVRGEYLWTKLPMREISSGVQRDLFADAWYVSGSLLLTGEDKPMDDRVVPVEPLDLEEGGIGAWELAARFGALDFDNDFFTAGFGNDAGTFASANGVRSLTLGVNWWVNRNARTSLNWIRNEFTDAVFFGPTDSRRAETAILMRFQVDF